MSVGWVIDPTKDAQMRDDVGSMTQPTVGSELLSYPELALT